MALQGVAGNKCTVRSGREVLAELQEGKNLHC